jgi:hypothetical protein
VADVPGKKSGMQERGLAAASRTMSITIMMTFNRNTFKYCIYIQISQVVCSVCIRVSPVLVVLLPGEVGLSMTEIRKWNEKCCSMLEHHLKYRDVAASSCI